MSIVLRSYQKAASDAAVKYFLEEDKRKHKYCGGLIVCPTGGGKSHLIADIAHRLNAPILIFAPSKELLLQDYDKMERIENGISTMYSASVGQKKISMITFATIGSAIRHIDDFDVFRYVIVDECFPYRQFVSTEIGQVRIGNLASMFKRGLQLPKVLSYNEKTKVCEPKKIKSVWCNGEREVNCYHFSGRIRISCTPNHPFLTNEGWKAIGDLKEGDCILSNKTKEGYAHIPNSDQAEFILGSIIGDGSIEKRERAKNMHRFGFTQGVKQIEYLQWKERLLGCEGSIYEGKSGFCDNRVYSFKSKVLYFEDYKCSKKYVIEHLTAKSLAIIWMDDGHLDTLQNAGTICAIAESEELTKMFADKLNSMGIDCCASQAKSSSSKKIYNFIRLRINGVKALCEMVAPYVHKSMVYKLTDSTKYLAGSYVWNSSYEPFTACVLMRTEKQGKQKVYNMEVEDNHTYIITTGRYDKDGGAYPTGIITHNCHDINSDGGMYERFIHHRADRKVVGLTATPFRLERDTLKFLTRTRPRIFGKVLYVCQVTELLSKGYLADPTYFDLTELNMDNVRSNSTGSDYDDASLTAEYERSGFYDKLFNTTMRVLSPKDGTRRKGVLVFTRFTREAEGLVRLLSAQGVKAATVSADTPPKERAVMINAFKEGKISVIVNVGILIKGFDYPELDTIIMARPTKSLAIWYQSVGRILRPSPNKRAWVIDLSGSYRRFGKVSDLKIGLEKSNSELWAVFSRGRKLTNTVIV